MLLVTPLSIGPWATANHQLPAKWVVTQGAAAQTTLFYDDNPPPHKPLPVTP